MESDALELARSVIDWWNENYADIEAKHLETHDDLYGHVPSFVAAASMFLARYDK
jgi:hypothetical protein